MNKKIEQKRAFSLHRIYFSTGAATLLLSASVLALQSGSAHADCAPVPTAGADNIVCDNAPPPGGANLDALAGPDTITVIDGAHGDIDGGANPDTINLNGGSVNTVLGGSGGDTINLDGATVNGSIFGESSTDTINLNSGTVFGFVDGGAEIDTINVNGATINNDVLGGNGNDVMTLNSGAVTAFFGGSAGNDSINVLGGFAGNVTGGADNDTILLDGGANVPGIVDGGTGNDSITVNAATVGDVTGGTGPDTINLNAGATVASVSAGTGSDTVNLDGATVTGTLFGDEDADLINLNSGSVGGFVDGGGGNDTININGATIGAGDVLGGLGNDTLNMNSGTVGLNVGGSAGDDTLNLLGGTANNATGGDDNDTITLNGATITNNVSGGNGNDTINLLSGTANGALGGTGQDTITLNGATIAANLDAGADNDTFNLQSGSFGGDLEGEAGDDTATIASSFDLSTITGLLDGGADTDTLNVQASGNLTADNIVNWEIFNTTSNLTMLGGVLSVGQWNVNGGTVNLDDGLAVLGNVTNNATLIANNGGGTYVVTGTLANNGTINMSDGVGTGDTLVAGTFDPGGTILMDVALDASLQGDQVVVGGFTGGGTTALVLTDVAPLNPSTDTGIGPGAGIPIVNAAGASPTGSEFALAGGAISKAPFTYNLVLETDDVFYLQSGGVLGQVVGYAVLTEVMRSDMPLLRDRRGETRTGGGTNGVSSMSSSTLSPTDNAGIWARIDGNIRDIEGASIGDWKSRRAEAEVGLDIPMEVFGPVSTFGISVHGIKGDAETDSNAGLSSDMDTTGFGAGLAMAFFPGDGFYVDLQGRITAWDADVDAAGVDQDVDALGWGASIEAGKRMRVAPNTAITPRGRAIYTDVDFDSFTDGMGATVSQDDSASLVFEAGVTIEQMFESSNVSAFVDASVSHDVLSDSSVDVAGFGFESGLPDTWGALQIGVAAGIAQGTSAYVAADVGSPFNSTFGESMSYGLEAGLRFNF